jgi:drug/metabolite transporter (DMT)-like permease
MSNALKVNLALLSAVILWSGAFVAIRMSLTGYSPGSVGLFRFGLASICLALPMFFNAKLPRLNRQQVLSLLFIGTVGTAAYSILLNSGEKSISPGMASFLVAQTPIINTILAMGFLKERTSLNSIIAISISCIGVAIIVLGQPIQHNFNLGLMLVITATICGSIQSIMQKYMLGQLSPWHVCAISTWFATLALLFFLPNLIDEFAKAPASATWAAIFLGLVPSTIGQWLWSYGLSKTLVAKASAYLYMMPFLSTLFAWLVLSEWPSTLELVGGLMALLGVILVKKDVSPQKNRRGTTDPALPTL